MAFIEKFKNAQTDALTCLRTSTDLSYLKEQLVITNNSAPDCAAESLYRTNKISILKNRIKELEDELSAFTITQKQVATS
jgi:hypothetical protein